MFYLTLLRHSVDKLESFSAPVQFFAKKKEDEKIQQIVCVNIKLEKFIYLLDIMNSVYKTLLVKNPFVMSYKK